VVVASGAVTTWVGATERAGVKLGDLPGALNRPMGVSLLPDERVVIAESMENVILLVKGR
jgi:hypothetical protein